MKNDYLLSDLAMLMPLLIASLSCCWGNDGGTKGKANTKFWEMCLYIVAALPTTNQFILH
jgi:hypothetical protein